MFSRLADNRLDGIGGKRFKNVVESSKPYGLNGIVDASISCDDDDNCFWGRFLDFFQKIKA